ncbi:RTA1 like protein-domain-containing protein [Clohesyomyces aquaticus]|uniref:RTA1 like protein-domain-containing protein n=1 Tax=Clohesyomyces aquaticus TaxID=1231657 RepID=A0A1Y2A3N0_9PLEO|nr:RTA1 like protein-domain-containing protein [Clohesyomyces aquaticus]
MALHFDFEKFRYVPSLAGAIVSIVIFSILAALHLWQLFRNKTKIMIWVVVGAFCEVIGYAARVESHYNKESWAFFIVQGVFILVGPLFFAATIYMMLARTIRLADGEDVSVIKPQWCTRIFVTADVSTLIIQGLGASVMGTMQVALAIAGDKIVKAGLAVQVATFVFFLVVAVDFHRRMNKKIRADTGSPFSDDWRRILWYLYSMSALILGRCVCRLIEYGMGNAAYPMAHEWYLYVFDTTPMVMVLILLLVLQPAKYVPQKIESSRGEIESRLEQSEEN